MPLAHELITPALRQALVFPTTTTSGVYAQRAMRRWFYGARVPKRLGLEPGLLRQAVLNVVSVLVPRTLCSCVQCQQMHYLTSAAFQRWMLFGRCPICDLYQRVVDAPCA